MPELNPHDRNSLHDLIQVEPDHYAQRSYNNKTRFISYWHQIDEVLKTGAERVLEIGVGNGFVANYLRQQGVQVETLDIDQRLAPTHVGSVTNIPCETNAYEAVACFEVLEHLPFEQSCLALAELARVSSKWVIVSVPDASRTIRLFARLPFNLKIRKIIRTPTIRPIRLEPGGEHYWEIGVKGYPAKRVEKSFADCGLSVTRSFRIFENVRHHFFIARVT